MEAQGNVSSKCILCFCRFDPTPFRYKDYYNERKAARNSSLEEPAPVPDRAAAPAEQQQPSSLPVTAPRTASTAQQQASSLLIYPPVAQSQPQLFQQSGHASLPRSTAAVPAQPETIAAQGPAAVSEPWSPERLLQHVRDTAASAGQTGHFHQPSNDMLALLGEPLTPLSDVYLLAWMNIA